MILGLDLHVNLIASAAREPVAGQSPNIRFTGPESVSRVRRLASACDAKRGNPLAPHAWNRTARNRPSVLGDGDVVQTGLEPVTTKGQRRRNSSSSGGNSVGRARPPGPWRQYVVGADELWLVNTRVPNSRDSRCLGPISMSRVRVVANPARSGPLMRLPRRLTAGRRDCAMAFS
jgi:hypothetical protein